MTIEITPEPPQDDNQSEFQAFADTLPETADGFLDAALPRAVNESVKGADHMTGGDFYGVAGPDEATPSAPRKAVNVTKKMQRAMKKLRGKVADVPIMWFHMQATAHPNHPEWELDKDERDMMQDAIDTVFDVLDVNIEVEPLSWHLTSVWWVVSYPILAFVFLFLTKKSLTMDRGQGGDDVNV